MKTETAVNYIIKEFSEILGKIVTNPMQDLLIVDAINKAREKEKQQIIDAFAAANTIDQQGTIDAEQYYDDTFNPQFKTK